MEVRDVETTSESGVSMLRAVVQTESRPDFELQASWTGAAPGLEEVAGDALVGFLLVPAMALGEELELGDVDVSARLQASLERIQALYSSWSRGLSRIDVTAGQTRRVKREGGTALFFSGGVDAWYSLLTAQDAGGAPSHLIFMRGFDIDERHPARMERAQDAARKVAEDRNATLITSRSNLRSFTDPLVGWGLYHGGYLAAVSLGLGGELSRSMISASNSPTSGRPWGSHPDLDVLWSTESLVLEHRGFETDRFTKLKRIAESSEALKTLRVCWQPVDEYNCGHCQKCTLVMAGLRLLGKLEQATTFPDEIDLQILRSVEAGRIGERRTMVNAMLPVAEERGELQIVQALKQARRSRYLKPHNYLEAMGRRLKPSSERAYLNRYNWRTRTARGKPGPK